MRLGRGALVALMLLFTTSAPSARAAVMMTGDEEVIVQSHEVIEDDLIVWASYVRVDGLVKGDLVVFGMEVVVEGIVEGDLIALGKTVYVNGQVGDDARIGAYAVALGEQARIGDDLFELGYSLETKPGSLVGGTLHTASRQALLGGKVVEEQLVRAGALELRGLTGGDVRAVVGGLEGVTHSDLVLDLALEIPSVPDGVTLGADAAIGGDLVYRSQDLASIDPGARVDGEVRHEEWRTHPAGPIELPSLEDEDSRISEATERLAILLLVGLLLAVAVPAWLRARGETAREGPAGMLGWGIGALIFGVIASGIVGIVGFSTLAIGIAIGSGSLAGTAIVAGALLQMALFALFGIALLYVAPVLASAGIGSTVLARLRPRGDDAASSVVDAMLLVAVGAVAYSVLRAVPGLGWIFGVCAALVGLGVLTLWLRDVFLDAS